MAAVLKTLYREEGEQAIVEAGSSAEASMRAMGFTDKPKKKSAKAAAKKKD